MICLKPSHYRRIAELEGKLAAAQSELKDLQSKNAILENHKQEITDWLLSLQGAPSVYGHEPRSRRDTEPQTQPNPFAAASRGRDFSRIAESLENQAMSAYEALKN